MHAKTVPPAQLTVDAFVSCLKADGYRTLVFAEEMEIRTSLQMENH